MKVEIYTTPTCHFCHMAKDFFKENSVEFTEYDVSADHAKAEEMINRTGQMGVPVIAITKDEGEPVLLVGFQEDRIKSELGL